MDTIKKHFSIFEITLVTTIISIHLYAAFSDAFNFPNLWFMRDDAYYYFKVAQNISEGLGSTFDGINPTNGYHPLWMLVCIPIFAFARFDLILPLRILLMVIALLNAATAVMIYRLVKSNLSRAVAMAAAAFWAFNYYIHSTVYEPGLETPLAAFAIVLFIYKLSQFETHRRIKTVATRQIIELAICATIAMFSRLDLVFLALIGGLWIIFRDEPIRLLLPLDILIIFASLTSSVAIRTGIALYNTTYAGFTIQMAILVLIFKVTSLYFLGAYQNPRTDSAAKIIRKIFIAITASSIISAALYLFLHQLGWGKDFPRTAFLIDWGYSLVLLSAIRLITRAAGASHHNRESDAQTITPIAQIKSMWKKWLTDGIAYYGILGGALTLYMLYNKISFGTSSPVSGQVKRWWGTLIETVYESPASDWPSFFGLSYRWAYDAWKPASNLFLWIAKIIYPLYPGSNTLDERYFMTIFAFAILAFFILFINIRRTKKNLSNMALIPLATSCGIQILSYTTTAYGGVKEWYWASQIVLITLAGSVLVDALLHPLQHLSWRILKGKIKPINFALELASIVLSIFLAYQFCNWVYSYMRYNSFPSDLPYMSVLPYIEENTSPGSIIGVTGGGNLGYFIHDRTIVNMDGLINSNEYFHALQNGEAPVYLRQHGVTILFASPRLLGFPPYNGQFAPYLENYSAYGGKNLIYLLDKPKY